MATQLARTVPMEMRRFDSLDPLAVADMLARSGYFGDVKEAGQALAKILAGQELGVGPIASLMGVYYQQGKVTYSANIMAAAIKKSIWLDYRVRKHTDDVCEIEFFDSSPSGKRESLGVSSFSREDAKKGGLLDGPNKHNWAKWPRNMVFARAMSNGCKWYCPGIFGGITPYTPDELGAEVSVTDDGEMVVSETPQGQAPIRIIGDTSELARAEGAHAEAAVNGDEPETTHRDALLAGWPALVAKAEEYRIKQWGTFAQTDPETLDDARLEKAMAVMQERIKEATEAAF